MIFFSIVVAAIFLFLTGLFAGTETGFVCLNQQLVRHRAENPANTREKTLLEIGRKPERFLALTLIGINMSTVVATSLLTEVFQQFGAMAVTIGTLLSSSFIFLCCELIPKLVFTAHPLKSLLRFLPILVVFDWLLSLPVTVVTGMTRMVLSTLGLRTEHGKRHISREELLILIGRGASSGAIHERPHGMVKGIIGLKDKNVSEVMVPRPRLAALEEKTSPNEAKKLVLDSGFSRIPVYSGTIDQVVGVLYFKDLFLRSEEALSLKELVSSPIFVPELRNAYALFCEMRLQNYQIAVVLDEFGSTSGIVTLEDLVEEVVGEIQDEFDKPVFGLKHHSDGSISLKSDMHLTDLEKGSGIKFEPIDNMTTVNGLILATFGRIPEAGERLTVQGRCIEILDANKRRVLTVKLYRPSGPGS